MPKKRVLVAGRPELRAQICDLLLQMLQQVRKAIGALRDVALLLPLQGKAQSLHLAVLFGQGLPRKCEFPL